MSLPAIIMWAVVLLIGIPSAWWNPTAAALVFCWLVGEAIFVLTGNCLPVNYYVFPDIVVLAVIFAKQEYCNQGMYRSTWHQIKCILLERSPSDRCVMLIFPVMWWAYVADISDYSKWWILWGAAILQFLFASAESFPQILRHHAEVMNRPSADPGALLVASGGWSG